MCLFVRMIGTQGRFSGSMRREHFEDGDYEHHLTGGHAKHPFDSLGLGFGGFSFELEFKILEIPPHGQFQFLEIPPRSQFIQVRLENAGQRFGLNLGLLFGKPNSFQFLDVCVRIEGYGSHIQIPGKLVAKPAYHNPIQISKSPHLLIRALDSRHMLYSRV